MILPQSDLKLLKFDVLESHISYVSSKTQDDGGFQIDESKYIIDLDFDVSISKRGTIFIYTNVLVNKADSDFPCHVIDVSAGSVFVIESSEKVTKQLRDIYIEQSAISIAFNNLRGYIQNITSYLPMGVYTLPLFSPHKLILDKNLKQKKIKESLPTKRAKKKAIGNKEGMHPTN